MKRRNFLSGLAAAPLALKARLAQFFGRKPVEVCNALLGKVVLSKQPDVKSLQAKLLEAKSPADFILALGKPLPTRLVPVPQFIGLASSPVRCSLPRGHKGPHVLLNPR